MLVTSIEALGMSLAMGIGFLAGRYFASFWLKFIFFVVAAVAGILACPFIGGMWAATHPEQDQILLAPLHKHIWAEIGGVTAMAYFGVWRLPDLIEEARQRGQFIRRRRSEGIE